MPLIVDEELQKSKVIKVNKLRINIGFSSSFAAKLIQGHRVLCFYVS